MVASRPIAPAVPRLPRSRGGSGAWTKIGCCWIGTTTGSAAAGSDGTIRVSVWSADEYAAPARADCSCAAGGVYAAVASASVFQDFVASASVFHDFVVSVSYTHLRAHET